MAITVHDTIPRPFLASVESYHRPDAFRHKVAGTYRDISHGEVYARVSALACALRKLGIAKRDRVAILSENRIEWAVTVNDPATWTKPWTFSMPLTKTDTEPVLEFACHEGNYALPHILSGARAAEAKQH